MISYGYEGQFSNHVLLHQWVGFLFLKVKYWETNAVVQVTFSYYTPWRTQLQDCRPLIKVINLGKYERVQSAYQSMLNKGNSWPQLALPTPPAYLHPQFPDWEHNFYYRPFWCFPKPLQEGKQFTQTKPVFRVKSRGRATKEERQPSWTVVPPRWWHHIKPLSTSIPLSQWAVLVKTTAMTKILLVGAPGKHHKTIKSKVTLCPHYMSTRLWNKNPPVWCQHECQGHRDGEAVNTVGFVGDRYGY